MAPKTQTIEVDEATAATLRGRAEAQGMSVAELIAGMTAISVVLSSADLDRQWASVEAGEATVPHGEVIRWLHSWGTPSFKRWRDQ
jgi:predicted transcriptional regulator